MKVILNRIIVLMKYSCWFAYSFSERVRVFSESDCTWLKTTILSNEWRSSFYEKTSFVLLHVGLMCKRVELTLTCVHMHTPLFCIKKYTIKIQVQQFPRRFPKLQWFPYVARCLVSWFFVSKLLRHIFSQIMPIWKLRNNPAVITLSYSSSSYVLIQGACNNVWSSLSKFL